MKQLLRSQHLLRESGDESGSVNLRADSKPRSETAQIKHISTNVLLISNRIKRWIIKCHQQERKGGFVGAKLRLRHGERQPEGRQHVCVVNI